MPKNTTTNIEIRHVMEPPPKPETEKVEIQSTSTDGDNSTRNVLAFLVILLIMGFIIYSNSSSWFPPANDLTTNTTSSLPAEQRPVIKDYITNPTGGSPQSISNPSPGPTPSPLPSPTIPPPTNPPTPNINNAMQPIQ